MLYVCTFGQVQEEAHPVTLAVAHPKEALWTQTDKLKKEESKQTEEKLRNT